jgi:tetratricopeptide (TPR) repeat protein
MSEKEEREAHIDGESVLEEIDSLWDYSDPSGSERIFQRVLHGPNANNAEFRAQVLTQIARCQILQRRMDDGHATLDQAGQILSDQTPIAHIRYRLERGRAWNDAGRLADATAAFIEAFQRAQTVNSDLLCVDAAHMLGVVPPHEVAVIWNQRAIAIAQRSADSRARQWIGTLFMNMGVNHQHLRQYLQAESAFVSALSAFEQIGNSPRIRLAKLCLSKNLRLSGELGKALSTSSKLLLEIQSENEPPGYAFEEIAECLLAMGRNEESASMFAQAYAALSAYSWFPPNENERLLRMKRLAGM